ncbi:g1531 [Coccomyxa elongata]
MARLKAFVCLALLATSTTHSSADISGFFQSLGNTFSSAGNTIKDGAQATFQVVKSGTVEAANVTGEAFKNAGDAVVDGAKTAYNKTATFARQHFEGTKREINTLEGVLQNATSNLKQTVFDFKDSAIKELQPVADQVEAAAEKLANTTVRVVSDGVSGVVSFGNDTWRAFSADSPAADLAPAVLPLTSSQVTVDATSSRSVLAALRGNASDGGFPALAQSIVVALAEGRGRNVSAAVGAAVGAEAGRNETKVSQGLAQAFATAMLAADNATVQNAVPINSTEVAKVYVAGLQDAVSNCTAATKTTVPPNTQAWFQFYADKCCGTVTNTLGRMSLIMQQVPDRAASDAWFKTLGDSYQLGQAPVFNLARCLAADKNIVSVQAA